MYTYIYVPLILSLVSHSLFLFAFLLSDVVQAILRIFLSLLSLLKHQLNRVLIFCKEAYLVSS